MYFPTVWAGCNLVPWWWDSCFLCIVSLNWCLQHWWWLIIDIFIHLYWRMTLKSSRSVALNFSCRTSTFYTPDFLTKYIVSSILYTDCSHPSHFPLWLSTPDFPFPSTSSLSLSCDVIFLFYLKATKDQALERHFNLLTGLWKAPPVRFGCHGTVNGVYLLNGKREPQHRSHLREKMAVDITAGTEHYPSVKENGDF